MQRLIYQKLIDWKTRQNRVPLLLRGARQVGKSYLVETFGRQQFEKLHIINFEFEPTYKQCFETFEPQKIINAISALSQQTIEPGKSLLFLDEIQTCPKAIMALRYFKEKMPELHVIGAGSLLEFALQDKNLSMPVGRVEYLYLKPLSFCEFLHAMNHERLIDAIKACDLHHPIEPPLHEKLLELARDYLLVGGMPAAVDAFRQQQDYEAAQRQQTIILSTYRDDFGKYAKLKDHQYLQKIFEQTPALVGQQIQYSKIDPNSRSRDLKRAIRDLSYAGVLHTLYATTASGLPLNALINEKKIKLLFLDIGLMAKTMRISLNDLMNEEINLINKGALAEQWVGQELLAYLSPYEMPQLHFWTREKTGSHAEVDYIINIDSRIIPIEVKAGKTGRLKSLHLYIEEKQPKLGIQISQAPLSQQDTILTIPFYLISELPRLIN